MSDLETALKYHNFLKEKYGSEVFSRSKKREIVLNRKLIILFFVKEKEFKVTFVSWIMEMSHSDIFYYLRPVHDLEFERYYVPRARELKEEFDKKFPKDET